MYGYWSTMTSRQAGYYKCNSPQGIVKATTVSDNSPEIYLKSLSDVGKPKYIGEITSIIRFVPVIPRDRIEEMYCQQICCGDMNCPMCDPYL